jgi:hypothetical protein
VFKVTNFPMIKGFFVTLCHLYEYKGRRMAGLKTNPVSRG